MKGKALHLFYLCFGITLQSGSSIKVRLTGGNSSSAGRVELQYQGIWGTICDDRWTIDNANVVCRMLSFDGAFITKRFGPGSGQIWLDEISCTGSETSIVKCIHGGWGNHDCGHSEDVGVICINGYPNISVRLINGSIPHAGQIELRYFDIWRPVCDVYWTLRDANVVCRMLGYRQGASLAVRGYKNSTGDAWLTNIRCSGTEASIDKCRRIYWGQMRCPNDYRAAVVCASPGQRPNLAVRLVNGSTSRPNQGRVEVRYYGIWGTICDDYWGIGNAHVVCRMLNYSKALTTGTASNRGSGPILLDDVACSGFEKSLELCWNRGWGQHNCHHREDVAVTCKTGEKAYPDLSVRLIYGSLPYTGEVEIRYYGIWKPVCDKHWTLQDANVVCKMLGYPQGAALAFRGYQNSTGDAWRTLMSCSGTETSIDKCRHLYWGHINCKSVFRAGVACNSSQDANAAVRLVGGPSPNQGRIEVRYYGVWGTVCDDYWGINDAHVVCRMLNYSKALTTGTASNRGSGPIILDDVFCRGFEKSLELCWNRGWGQHNCDHREDVAVTCENKTIALKPNIAVRLVDGSTPNQGRVEVRYYGVWGTVCDDHWGLADAHVVCRMLNYSKASWAGTAKVNGRGPIALDDVQCRGNEKSIQDCRKNGWGWHNCRHVEDAGVKCEKLTKEELNVAVRLTGKKQEYIGYVEVQYNGTWRPVCDDTWDTADAHVICRMLGYKSALLGIKSSRLGKIGLWLGNVECGGEEKSVSECYHRGWSNTWCPGRLYAGVMCNVTKDFPTVGVRLEEGSSPNSGRVALRYGNLWGTICRKELNINEAKVICRMLGYPSALYTYNFKPGKDTTWLMDLQCKGTEKSLIDCRHGWGKTTSCSHADDAAIMCKKADAPRFLINGTNAITKSTVEILFTAPESTTNYLQSVYQVAVEKRSVEKDFQSAGQVVPSIFMDDVNVPIAMSKYNNSYITAAIPSEILTFTIGDGRYYHGYYNAPLVPATQYKVYVRIVTNTVEKKPIYSGTAFVDFTTKAQTIDNKATSAKYANDDASLHKTVIGLSVIVVLVVIIIIFIIIGYSVLRYLKKKNQNKACVSERTDTDNEPSSPYKRFPSVQQNNVDDDNEMATRLSSRNMKDKPGTVVVSEENEPPSSSNQAWHFPSDISGFENQAYNVTDIRLKELNFVQGEEES